MKKALLLFAITMVCAGYIMAACGAAECGGGTTTCCTTKNGDTYYMTAKPPKNQ